MQFIADAHAGTEICATTLGRRQGLAVGAATCLVHNEASYDARISYASPLAVGLLCRYLIGTKQALLHELPQTHDHEELEMTGLVSGIKIPDSKIAREAADLVRQHETEMLFNHSVRVYMFGALKGMHQNLKFDAELLYVAALFHDLGLVDAFHTETKRFEVDGADAAREFLRRHGISELKQDLVWEAIALHTTPGIPQYMRPEIALTNAGVLVDVVGIGFDDYTPEQRNQVITAFPRGDFKNEFVKVQTCSALRKPSTTFGTVNFDYIQHHDPTFQKPNACTRIHGTPWDS